MRIRRKFLQLTRQTIPYGNEDKMKTYLPKGIQKDEFGNYFISVGDGYSTMFTCHLDTACSYDKTVNHRQAERFIGTDGKTILGADDKAGMVVMLYMIENQVPGLYYFFVGEEVGCVGSSALAEKFEHPTIMKVVSFDRRGTTSVITEQMFGKCCSDEFAEALSEAINSAGHGLKLAPDNTGILTDSAQFVELVPECTNISVGYYNEHTTSEIQDIDYLISLCRSVVKVDWESLPIVRDPGDDGYECSVPGWDDDILDDETIESNEYNEEYSTNIVSNGKTKKMYISKFWIEYERELLTDMLKKNGYGPERVVWDGNSCWCDEGDGDWKYIGNREEVSHLVDIQYIPYEHLKEKI